MAENGVKPFHFLSSQVIIGLIIACFGYLLTKGIDTNLSILHELQSATQELRIEVNNGNSASELRDIAINSKDNILTHRIEMLEASARNYANATYNIEKLQARVKYLEDKVK